MRIRSILEFTTITALILACISMLFESINLAMLGADREASLRLLSEFHLKFNSEAGISPDKYRDAVEKFATQNPDFRGLWFYKSYLAEGEKRLSSDGNSP